MLNLTAWSTEAHERLKKETSALDYLKSRNITSSLVDKFSIGFIKKFYQLQGSSIEASQWNQTFCSGKFPTTNRLIFPHHDDNNSVISFSTRSLSSKYYSHFIPEYASFKGNFWGWKQALPHIWESRTVFITEGIFDLLSIAHVKPNSVCSLTRTLTEGQFRRIIRYADKFILAFDMDEPGRKGCEYWEDRFQKVGKSASILEYPYKDLNEWWVSDPRNMIQKLSL